MIQVKKYTSTALICVAALALLMMTGCSQLSELPSLQYCEHVSYTRTERAMHIEADCQMPYGRI